MNCNLLKNNYLIIPNFISEEKAIKLSEDFFQYCEENDIKGDEQSPNSCSSHNYISFLELLCEKTPKISSILNESVLPTYTYARIYKKGAILDPHIDRDACEISITLHLEGDDYWPIFIKTPSGETHSVNLNPGDAMLYLGTIAEHWRDEYKGNAYTQVFLHYVLSRGKCSYAYFDKSRVFEDKKTNQKPNQLETNQEPNQLETELNTKTYSPIIMSSQTKIEDFIQVFDDVMCEDICDLILKEYQNSDEWDDSVVAGGLYKDIRNCTQIQISSDETIHKNYQNRKHIDDLVLNSVSNVIKIYSEICPHFQIDVDTGYQLLRYREGEFYTQHTDSFKEQQRSLSCSIQLNEDYEGGEFAFFDREMMIRSKKGSVIVFPSNFMYPHEIMPVISGTRYSIITWLV
jgi:predicted 2-oxoglutarate/Fe(II)-dependent dioxygenase YbiX